MYSASTSEIVSAVDILDCIIAGDPPDYEICSFYYYPGNKEMNCK